jgi:hypothetical protein
MATGAQAKAVIFIVPQFGISAAKNVGALQLHFIGSFIAPLASTAPTDAFTKFLVHLITDCFF